MVRSRFCNLFMVIPMLLVGSWVYAQTTVSGVVNDDKGEPLIGASIMVKGSMTGTVSDYDGSFEFTTQKTPPFTLVISYVSFETQEIEYATAGQDVNVSLAEQGVVGSEVVVSASRKPETILESPVSIERMGTKEIKETASANFYDAIENLKGVQMGTNSLTFKSVNTRGFASFANTRFVQVIDGMDNAAPGLNFPAGNLVGISELDVNSVELVPGSASALYGPNAFNGILIMQSRNPFLQPGLSVSLRGGVTQQDSGAGTNPYGQFNIRYAHKFSDKVATKFNFSALQGTDWWVNDFGDVDGGLPTDPDYDGINLYGDEVATSLTLLESDGAGGVVSVPTRIARTGYAESDLVDDDYDATSYKFDAAIHYKPFENAEFQYQYRYGAGQSIYQGTNRYRLRGLNLQQHKLEVKGDNYLVRAYTTRENAGDSYDTRFQAFNINRAWKSDQNWFLDYLLAYSGLENLVLSQGFPTSIIPASLLDKLPTPGDHAGARDFADGDYFNNVNLTGPEQNFMDLAINLFTGGAVPNWTRNDKPWQGPDSPLFQDVKNDISYKADLATGSKFIDRSRLYHAEVLYNIAPHINEFMDVQIGGNFRRYVLDSEGTIFNDGPSGFDGPIEIDEFGAYVQASKGFLDQERLKVTASVRFDKNSNFDAVVSPRASLVYAMGENKQHNFRASFQTGFRNPDTQPQYIALDLGAITLVGTTEDNLSRFSVDRFYNNGTEIVSITGEKIFSESYTQSSVGAFAATGDPSVLEVAELDYVAPERITAYEVGYKGLPLDKLFLDANVYFNKYTDFRGNQNVITPTKGSALDPAGSGIADIANGEFGVFFLYTNADVPVYSWGAGLNAEYSLPKGFKLKANYSYADLSYDEEADPDFQPSFNTPNHRVKFGIGNSDVWNGLGFNISTRWFDEYEWQASFVNGTVESAFVMDAQVSYKIPKIKSIVKVGAANLLNNEYQTAAGAAFVGRQFYVGILYDDLFR